MKKKPKAKDNKAKDVEAPKLKHIDIPNAAKAEINQMNQNFDRYITGLVVGMGVKGKWDYDAQRMQIILEDTDGENKT